ncbi:hypothetical protein A1A1_16645 [Planococcus antarcticus DSM 14505]|uniref:Uncharacterized protein n=1 Tax=Planococcus antarcticus DSM 14505 TaxID=1185653 RepID=A0AA87LRI1_9BACL|nr:hypothetical protein A1A1_16645 [Planococcus antarcticus DSM 14505]
MLLHRFASFVAKPLPELSSFNDFPAVKRHPGDPAGVYDEGAGATSCRASCMTHILWAQSVRL